MWGVPTVNEYLPFVIIGITTGSLYGLAGLGLVLTYRTSGIFNFAHGAIAAAAAYLFYSLHYNRGWSWPVAMAASVAVFGLVAGLIMERLCRSLAAARTANIIVATVGLYLFIQGTLSWHYGPQRRSMQEFLPDGQAIRISDVPVSWAQVIVVGVGVAVLVGLTVFLRLTRLGLAMQAVVADPGLLSMSGTDPVRVSRVSWMFGCSVAATTGILIAPTLGLDAVLLAALVVQAFGAVAIGRFVSLPMTYLGGLVIGVLAQLATKEFAARPTWNGVPSVVPFVVLIAVMLASQSRRLPVGAGRSAGKSIRPSGLRLPVRRAYLAGGLLGLIVLPQLVGTRLPVYNAALIFALLFLSLGLLTGVSGQISLAHAAFAGVGAAVFSHFTVDAGLPWLLALVGAGLLTAAVGLVLALPAMRLSGLYLALATYGFALLMDLVFFRTEWLFGQSNNGLPGRRPSLGSLLEPGNDKHYYYVSLVVVLSSAALILLLCRSRLGLYLRAMAGSSLALNTMGLNVHVTKAIVFAISAFFAGVAGALYIGQIGQLSALSFSSSYSLLYLAVFVVAAILPGLLLPSFVAAGLLLVLPSYLTSVTLEVQSMLFGSVAVLIALVGDRRPDWPALKRRADARLDRALAAGDRRRGWGPMRPCADPEPMSTGRGR